MNKIFFLKKVFISFLFCFHAIWALDFTVTPSTNTFETTEANTSAYVEFSLNVTNSSSTEDEILYCSVNDTTEAECKLFRYNTDEKSNNLKIPAGTGALGYNEYKFRVYGKTDDLIDGDKNYKVAISTQRYLGDSSDTPSNTTITTGEVFDFVNIDDGNEPVVTPPTTPDKIVVDLFDDSSQMPDDKGSFSIVLSQEPTDDVTINFSIDTNKGTLSTSSVTFNSSNWNQRQRVDISPVADVTQNIDVQILAASSNDSYYDGVDPNDIVVSNTAVPVQTTPKEILVESQTNYIVNEDGATSINLEIKLSEQPDSNLTVNVTNVNRTNIMMTGGTVPSSFLQNWQHSFTFTPANWDTPQILTITGIDNDFADGDSICTFNFSTYWNNTSITNSIEVTNKDDETLPITITASDSTTSEGGETGLINIELSKAPTANVVFTIESLDTTEGSIDTSTVIFDSSNWATPQTVTINGVDDSLVDLEKEYIVQVTWESLDNSFNIGLGNVLSSDDLNVPIGIPLNHKRFNFINADNDSIFTVTPIDSVTSEDGDTASFSIVLNSQPDDFVRLNFSSNNSLEGIVTSPATKYIDFFDDNWNVPQIVTITGVDDSVIDSIKSYGIEIKPQGPEDDSYGGVVVAQTVTMTNNDNNVPTVISVTVPSNTTYMLGESLDFVVNMSENVVVDTTSGTPRLALTIDNSLKYATYISGSNSNALTFRYTLESGLIDSDGIVVGALDLNGATINDSPENNLDTTLNSIGSTTSVLVDTVKPTIIISSNDEALKVGDVATLTFTLSETSTDFTKDDITVSGGTLGATLNGSGKIYTISFTPTTNSTSSATIDVAANKFTDAAGNNNESATQKILAVDTVKPTIVISSNDEALKVGDVATLTFTLSETSTDFTKDDITVSGGTLGATLNGSGKIYTISFTPTTDSISSATIDVSANKFTDAAGNNNESATQKILAVDTVAPSVSSVIVPSNKTYILGDTLSFTINTTENIIIDTTSAKPQIAIDIGGTTKYATYVSGTGTKALVFNYIIESGLEDINGITLASSIETNGAIMKDAFDNTLNTTLNSISSTSLVFVDSIIPVISTYTPAVDASNIELTDDLVLIFSEDLKEDTGVIEIYEYDTDNLVETFTTSDITPNNNLKIENISDTNSTVSNTTVTITRGLKLSLNKTYYVLISNGAFTDLNGNAFEGITSKDTWKFTTIANHAPVITSIDGKAIASQDTTYSVAVDENQTAVTTITSNDEDLQNITYSLSGVDANSFEINGLGVITFKTKPNFEEKSNYTIDVNVTDNGIGMLSDSITLTVNINDINDEPTITIDSSLITDEDVSKNLVFTYIDEDKDTITATEKTSPSKGSISINGTTITYTPNLNQYGSDSFILTLSDGNGYSIDKSIDVTINAVDDAPTITTQLDDVVQNEDGEGLIIELSTTDIDTNIAQSGVLYSVNTSTDLVAKVFIFNGDLIVIPIKNANGSVTIDVTATVNGLSDTKSFVYTLNSINDAPFIESIGNVTLEQSPNIISKTITFDISDDEGISSLVAVSSDTNFISNDDISVNILSSTSAIFNYSIDKNKVGTSKITITATDTNNVSYSESFNITTMVVEDALCVSDTINALSFDDIKGDNTSQTSITKDLSLVTSLNDVCNSTIVWSTSDETIVSNSGVVTQNSQESTIIMRATVAKGDFSGNKDFLLTIPSNSITDEAALEKLTFQEIKANNQRVDKIVSSLNLLETIVGKNITWSSTDSSVINPYTGYVTRYSTDTDVTLTATIGSLSKDFELTVLKVETLDVNKVSLDKELLTLDSILGENKDAYNIEYDLKKPLPTLGSNGSTISWSSSNTEFITNDGDVYRDETEDKTLLMTATISSGVESDTKVFNFIVKQNIIKDNSTTFKNSQDTNDGTEVTTSENGNDTKTSASFGSTILGIVEKIVSNDTIKNIIQLVDEVVNIYLNTDGTSQVSKQNDDGSSSSIKTEGNGSSTTVDNNGNVQTQFSGSNNSTVSLNLNSDGTVSHTVTNGSNSTTITSGLTNTNSNADKDGNVTTSSSFSQNGFVYKVVVETDNEGNTTTKYQKVDLTTGQSKDESGGVSNTTPFPTGSSVNVSKIGGEVYISTVIPLDGNLVIE